MSTISETLAAFAHELTFDTLPDEVVEKVKLHLIDTVGIGLASTKMEFAGPVYKAAGELGTGDESTVFGFGTRHPAVFAALVNGTLAHGIDFDDTHIGAVLHVSAALASAGLAVGEARNASGKSLIESLAAGMEASIRLGLVARGGFNLRGMHQTGMCTPFGACLTSAKLSALSLGAMENGLGICGTMASGITQIEQSWLKRMNPGWAAHSGISAARLAGNGFLGPREVFEGVHGVFPSHLGADTAFPWERLTAGLGSHWEILDIAIKPYPACHYTHAFIDCAKKLKEEYHIDPKDIDIIECKASDGIVSMVLEPREEKLRPKNPYMAQFSVQFLVASMLVKGYVTLDTVYFEPLDDPAILEVAERIEWMPDPHSDFPVNFPGEMRIILKDGRECSTRESFNRGGPRNPLSKQEVTDKFLDNATRAVSSSQARELLKLLDGLETISDVSRLAQYYG